MTSDLNRFIRPHLLAMPEYEPIYPYSVIAEELGITQDEIVKLDANENPYGCLPEVVAAMSELDTTHVYPDPESRRIRLLLAEHHQIEVDSILVGAGADELIDLIIRLVINPGDGLLNCPPTFGMYSFDAVINQAKLIDVRRNRDFSLDLSAIRDAVQAYCPKILFLANPNNPDGKLIPSAQIQALLDLPVLLVLDEAYINYCSPESTWINQVSKYKNLIVLRSFSKYAGLAGLRVGYGVFPKLLVSTLMKAKQPYNVSVVAEEAACISIIHDDKIEYITRQIREERDRLFNQLGEIPWLIPYPSQANFILCKVIGRDALSIKQYLKRKGILVRHFKKPGLDDHIRISVGKPEQMDLLIDVLKRME